MAYDSKAIANYFIHTSERSAEGVSLMKIQKLVYFAHGWNLALAGRPLILDRTEAWEYGPVVRRLHSDFREYGTDPIPRLAFEFRMEGGHLFSFTPRLSDGDDAEENEYTRRLLDRVWVVYGKFTAIQLSNLSHAPTGPWATTRAENPGVKSPVIDDSRIKEYFMTLLHASPCPPELIGAEK